METTFTREMKFKRTVLLHAFRCEFIARGGKSPLTTKGKGHIPAWLWRFYCRQRCNLDKKYRDEMMNVLQYFSEPRNIDTRIINN